MLGTRLPDVRRDKPDGWKAWERRDRAIRLIAAPGSYMKVLREDGTLWCWYMRAPNGDVATLWPDRHTITENADGTITVSPSIVFPHGGRWHGFLVNGVWSGV
jgi:hypothetical protein